MRALTDEDYPHLEKLIKQLLAHKSSSAFREPVDVSDAPNYFRVIKDPMGTAVFYFPADVETNHPTDFFYLP